MQFLAVMRGRVKHDFYLCAPINLAVGNLRGVIGAIARSLSVLSRGDRVPDRHRNTRGVKFMHAHAWGKLAMLCIVPS